MFCLIKQSIIVGFFLLLLVFSSSFLARGQTISDAPRRMQVAIFLASEGSQIIYPDPVRFFEVPIFLPLPEELSFIP